MKPSILRNLLLSFLGFGLAMGAVFPLYAQFFVQWLPGMLHWFVVGCLVAGISIGICNYLLVRIVLLGKLEKLSEIANAISNGDVSLRCTIESDDVLGSIVKSVNNMTENLRNMLGQITHSTEHLAIAAERLSEATGGASKDVREQQAEIDQVATAVNEMVATVQEVARNAEQAANAAHRADEAARSGALVATEAMGGIDVLVREVDNAAQVIHALQTESGSIGMVLDVIKDIAEQTNLLALNAAIEAARAGEQGRGFAVVADEVRTLASRTRKSTQEIHQMIERLQSGASDAVRAMEQARERGREGEGQVEKAAESLGEIAGAVATINDMNTQIASAAEQQSAVAEEINRNVVNLNQVAVRSADASQRTAETSEDVAHSAAQLKDMLTRFHT